MLDKIWDWIVSDGKIVCAWFATVIVAICSFFGNLFGLNKPPVETTKPTISISESTSSSATSTTTTTTATTQKTIPAFSFNVVYNGETFAFTNTEAAALTRYTETMQTKNSYGTITEYVFVGVRLKDILQSFGIDASAFPAGTTLHAVATDGAFTNITLDLIQSDKTLLAWVQDNKDSLPPRLCPGASDNSTLYLKKTATLTIVLP